ncbi:MAG: hypothetical protein ACJ74Y_14150 [Bryobacteraceae bacterium]
MTLLQPGDELCLTTCDWCHKGTREEDLTETLDGSQVCPDCIAHYDSNFDTVRN